MLEPSGIERKDIAITNITQ